MNDHTKLLLKRECWFTNRPGTQRAKERQHKEGGRKSRGREEATHHTRPKKEAGHSGSVGSRCKKRGTYLDLLYAVPSRVDLQANQPASQSLLGLYRGLNWTESSRAPRWPQWLMTQGYPWKWIQLWSWWMKGILKGQGRGEELLSARLLLSGHPEVMSSEWPLPMITKQNRKAENLNSHC